MNLGAQAPIVARVQSNFRAIVEDHPLAKAKLGITATPLSPAEAIGNPERDDYPIMTGKERVLECCVLGADLHRLCLFGRDV